ncbi:unnamed protein product [Polarella glacialis]|uniref:Fe2OG dioxygenase domain-containing protein n=1 Tax=Polarella glacialis TaxID=89957 RepID=A0A813G4D4_POLGL|nr:unnamed protein product [Polarella glacialis]
MGSFREAYAADDSEHSEGWDGDDNLSEESEGESLDLNEFDEDGSEDDLTWDEVLQTEREFIQKQHRGRERQGGCVPFSVAFSGGGVRAAAFEAGVLWRLAQAGRLGDVEHFVAVSGGAYLASAFCSQIIAAGSPRGQEEPAWYLGIVAKTICRMQKNAGYLVRDISKACGLSPWHAPSLLTVEECESLVQEALQRGLRPSLPRERALDPTPLLSALAGPGALDRDGDGIIDAAEAAAAARSKLNAPLFSLTDARVWLGAAGGGGGPNISASWLARPENAALFASESRRVFAKLLDHRPEKFSRHSSQAPLPWAALTRAGALTAAVPSKLAALVQNMARLQDASPLLQHQHHQQLQGEPMQVIRYTRGGHYAPHSDSGWPGHREVSLLVYLRTPEVGGETCFFPDGDDGAIVGVLQGVPASTYFRRCAQLLRAAGATCVSPSRGDALAWRNKWRNDGSLELPRAHAACPVQVGEKWVASAWVGEPCDSTRHICQHGSR